MHTYIALLRGVNVGGSTKLPMREFAALLAELGLHDVNANGIGAVPALTAETSCAT